MTNTHSRNQMLCADYLDGIEVSELARSYGIGEKRVKQILDENEIPRRRRRKGELKKPLSRLHERIGLHLYDYREARGIELSDAANDLGWNRVKIRKVEKGVTEIELLDLLDLAAYTETQVQDLLKERYS